jgi:hypothetical protein
MPASRDGSSNGDVDSAKDEENAYLTKENREKDEMIEQMEVRRSYCCINCAHVLLVNIIGLVFLQQNPSWNLLLNRRRLCSCIMDLVSPL